MQRIVLLAQHPAAVGAAVGGGQRRTRHHERFVVPVPVQGERLAADRTGRRQPVQEGRQGADRGVQRGSWRARSRRCSVQRPSRSGSGPASEGSAPSGSAAWNRPSSWVVAKASSAACARA
ncbi:hypothetical protein O1L68_25910 [Streptomyces lydicus]|nr:hypothetical protein [Streptomyces lydicus]